MPFVIAVALTGGKNLFYFFLKKEKVLEGRQEHGLKRYLRFAPKKNPPTREDYYY